MSSKHVSEHDLSRARSKEPTPFFTRPGDAVVRPLFDLDAPGRTSARPGGTSPARTGLLPKRDPPLTADEERSAYESLIDEAREAGFLEGLAVGREEGQLSGLIAGREEGADAKLAELELELAAHQALVDGLRVARDECVRAARNRAIDLGFALAERLVGRQLDDAEVLRARLEEALGAVEDGLGAPIILKTAPSQAAVFAAIIKRTGTNQLAIEIEPDASIQPGDLAIECGGRRVASVMEEQLQRLREAVDAHG